MADVGDDVSDGTIFDVVFEVRGIEAGGEFVVQGFGLGAAGPTLDLVFDLADDSFAGEDASPGGVGGGLRGVWFGEFSGEGHGAPDCAGDAVEGNREVCKGEVGTGGFGDGVALRLLDLSLGFGLLVKQAGEVGADIDEFVQDAAVVLPVFCQVVGRRLRFYWGGVG